MRLTLIHLSDAHFSSGRNWIASKAQQVANAVWAEESTSEAYVVLFTGDIAKSGRADEYTAATTFLSELQADLADRNNKPIVRVFVVPGNHDCDFALETDTRRMAIDHIGTDFALFNVEGDIARQCVGVQDQFWTFARVWNGEQPTTTRRLFASEEADLKGFVLRLNLYDSSWLSTINEQQGRLLFPVHAIQPLVQDLRSAPLVLSLVHHPYNWFAANNARELRTLLESTSDIVLTGHEHASALYGKAPLGSEGCIHYFEGGVLQTSSTSDSSFSALFVDTGSETFRSVQFRWKGGFYQPKESPADWVPFRRNPLRAQRDFENKPAYGAKLRDIGTGFTHPAVKTSISREDLYIYPDLTSRTIHKPRNDAMFRTVESKDVVKRLSECKRALISGSDLSGKSTLAKSLYVDLSRTYRFVPLSLNGKGLAAVNATEVRRVLEAAINEQYGAASATLILQLPSAQKVLIIDDFDHCDLNVKGQCAFLDVVRTMFDRIIVLVDEFFGLQQWSRKSDQPEVFHDFEHFEICEFGHYLRGKLIERWVALGRENTITRECLDGEVARHEQLVSTMLGRNLLPAHPITIITILQAWEANQSHDTPGSYGYLYETLIIHALSSVEIKGADVDVVMTFLSTAAYTMLTLDRDYLEDSEWQSAADEYVSYYRVRLPADVTSRLERARIAKVANGRHSFRYPYNFYFFVARYVRDHINEARHSSELRRLVADMAAHVHYEQYANILTFYVYLSKDTEAIAEILGNAKAIYEDLMPCQFGADVSFINDLYTRYQSQGQSLPKLPESSTEENRDHYRRVLDEREASHPQQGAIEERRREKLKYSKELSDVIKVNIATKTLQILGQVVRNSPGSVPGDIKKAVASEAYRLGLRTLTAVLKVPANHTVFLRKYLVEIIKDYRASHNQSELLENELEQVADERIIGIAQAVAHGLIHRVSQAVGLRQLEDIYSEVLMELQGSISARLIDIAIKLDHFGAPPMNEINRLEKDLRGNHYAHNALRDLVFAYLYLRECGYRERDQLVSRFKLRSGVMLLENPDKKKGVRR